MWPTLSKNRGRQLGSGKKACEVGTHDQTGDRRLEPGGLCPNTEQGPQQAIAQHEHPNAEQKDPRRSEGWRHCV